MTNAPARRRGVNAAINKLHPEDRAVHAWYRFVLSFPPHLVRAYLQRFDITGERRVLDPFCGTGTVLVECKKLGIPSIGTEANPLAQYAATVKLDWRPDADALIAHAGQIARSTIATLRAAGISDEPASSPRAGHGALRTLPPEQQELLLNGSISPLPLHKTLVLLEHLKRVADERYTAHERLALANTLVTAVSNLRFGPEVGVGPPRHDAAVVGPWLTTIRAMAADLRTIRHRADVPAAVHHADARALGTALAPCSVDAVITSPPYPNEKDYTRTTRLESVLLGFIANKADLRSLKRGLLRSNTRGVYAADDDDALVSGYPAIERIARQIEKRRITLGKTSGFERLYARVTRLYFGGMARHLAGLRSILRPDARLAYVVGDQASYLRVMIHTGSILAGIAESLGYQVDGIDLFRTRLATATREQLREEVVLLRWRG